MRALITLVLLSVYALDCYAQTATPTGQPPTKEQLIQQGCHAPEITAGPEHDELLQIKHRIGPVIDTKDPHRIYVALADSPVINAWAISLNMTTSLICVPVAMVHFMGDAEGELAFILSHEIGHALDDQCKTQQGRLSIAESHGSLGAALGEILGGPKGAYNASRLAQQKACESRADEIGFVIFTKAGYNPFDAAGSFGRLEMYLGDTGTGFLDRLNAIGTDHPMTPDRIRHMREMLIRAHANSES